MVDFSLYLVTDRTLSLGRSTIDIVRAAVAGGVTCVQLREKKCATRFFIEEARLIKELLTKINPAVPLIINDRLDVALAVGADGVHLGQTDMAAVDARRLIGSSCIMGISAESVADAIRAENEGADYIGISPVFATTTKDDTVEPLGLQGIQAIRAAVSLPLVGIGGITADNTAKVIRAGADGIAVVSAIVGSPSPEDAARALKTQIIASRQHNRASTA